MIRHVAAYIEQDRTQTKRLRGIQIPRTIIDKDNVLCGYSESLGHRPIDLRRRPRSPLMDHRANAFDRLRRAL
jgi:hypothetical protein